MTDPPEPENLLDQLAATAPVERMRARWSALLSDAPRRRSWHLPWGLAAAVATVALAAVLIWRSAPPETRATETEAEIQITLARLRAPSTFERLQGVRAAADRPRIEPALRRALLDRLDHDPSVNVRLAVLDTLLSHPDGPPEVARLVRSLEAQHTAIVQAHLGYRLRRRRLVSETELARIIAQPTVRGAAREALARLEDL